ncbi:MAG: GYD domain-containing protein [Nitrospirae bacterium]|nr:GYD domain-containing protein [Nitrospirota bacterium]
MSTFALLTKLAPDEARDPRVREEHGRQWMTKVKAKCPGVKWLSHYLVLGPHDFLDLYEAANEEEAAKVAMISLSLGALSAETWTLLPYQRYLQLAKEM